MPTPFESDLQAISWHDLAHAYGPAHGTPDWIRGLRSDNKETRQYAIEQLSVSINHQGSVYPASLAAIPFLQALVRDESVQDRQDIILLLLRIAVGFPREWFPGGFSITRWAQQALLFFRSSTYVDLLVQVYEAVQKDVPSWIHLLTDSALPIRLAAGYGLAWFREEALVATPSVRRALDQSGDESEVVNHILSLGMLNGYMRSDQDSGRFRTYVESGGAPSIRTCAVMALANTTPEAIDDNMLGVLFDALLNLEPPPIFHWNDGFIEVCVAESLAFLGKRMPERVVPGLCDAITHLNAGVVTAIARALGEALFPERLSETDRFQGLNQYQQLFLTTLAENWLEVYGQNVLDLGFVDSLQRHGIPDSPGALAAYVTRTA